MVLVCDRDCVGGKSGGAAVVTELADRNERARSERWKNVCLAGGGG